jgi:anti-sigma regulatory factor (Ser/Thr protein kinase)
MNSPDRPAPTLGRPAEVRSAETDDVAQPFDADGLYGLRATVAAHASRLGAAAEQLDELLIVTSELASNAIRHGGGSGRFRLWRRGTTFYCQVSDDGAGITDPDVGTILPDPAGGPGGRGLWICRNLAVELTIEPGPDGRGTTVTAALPAA